MKRMLWWVSRLAPRWRREEWLREWTAELDATGRRRALANTVGAVAHVAWLWRHEWTLDTLAADATHALRVLLRRPAFTVTVLVTLSLGVGATTAMFTVVDAVLLRGLPYPQSDRLVAIWPNTTVAPQDVAEAERPRAGFDAIGGYSRWGFTLTGGAQAEAVSGARVTPGVLQALGVRPLRGRWFEPQDTRQGQGHVALIGEALWRRRFGGDPAAVGGQFDIEGVPYRVVGIMPATFEFPNRRSEVWTPLTIDAAADDYAVNFASLIGRLSPGTTVAAAGDQMRVYAGQLRRERPKQFGPRFLERAVVVPLQSQLVRNIRQPLLLLFAGVGILLVIACANVAHLMLSRAGSRQEEIALRSALGATRPRIVRQLLVESSVLAAVAGVAGLLLAYWLVGLMVPLVPDLPQITRAAVDGRVVGFATALALGTIALFGLAPALGASRTDMPAVWSGDRGGARSHRRGRLGPLIVWAEVALATMLVVAAALLARSFLQLTRVDLGFSGDAVLTLRASAPEFRYQTDDQIRVLFGDLLSRVRALPGVQDVGAIHLLPLTPDNWNPGVTVEGVATAEQYPSDVNWRVVTPDYFRTMGIPVRGGRTFTAADDEHAERVALVNETFVRAVFHGQNPMNRRIRTAFEGPAGWATIVGVVGDVRQHAVDQPPLPEMYRPFAQHPLDSMRLMVETAGDPAAAAPAVRAAIAGVDRDVAVDELQPLSAVVDSALGGARLPMMLATLFSLAAMTLGVVGVASILSFEVAERRPEIGVRLALGAPPAHIRRLFLLRGLGLGVAGVTGGVLAAVGAAGLLRSMLFGVSPTDPGTLAAVGTVFLAVIVLAAYLPARRAARVDPLQTLRSR
jgi:putative ABC transport system permease protein